jgi:amino acid adenylation domain-containing protein
VPPATLPQLFEAQAARDPQAPALLFEGVQISYGELNARANRLARRLVGLGVGPERVAAIALPRAIEPIVGLVATLKAGGVYLPLDVSYPPERTAFMLRDAAPTVLLTTAELDLPDVPGCTRLTMHDLDRDGSSSRHNLCDGDRTAPLTPQHPAYLIYTSGSTGTPKGVAMPAASLVNLFTWHAAHLPVGPGVRTAQFSATGFDVSLHEILSTLVHGRCLAIPSEELRRDPARLVRWLQDNRINQLFLPNVVLAAVCAAADDAGIHLGALRDVLQSGETLVVSEPIRRFLRTRPHLRIHNQYGSAEMQDVTTHTLTADRPDWPAIAPIGRPLWNTDAYLLDDDLRPADEGELYIAGAGLARGYLHSPGLTAERFRPDPFGRPGGRMYRTGDLARRNADGELEYIGRADSQIKIRGFRVELGEVEAVLAARDGVAHAAVTAHSAAGRRQLVGYVVPTDGAALDPAAIGAELAALLPAFMVPATVVVLDALPLTPSGKINRRALPPPAFTTHASNASNASNAGDAARPQTREQRVFCDAFAEVLTVPAVGPDDSLFELGGDSIAAIHLVAAARRAGLEISTREVFEQRTPRGLAAVARAGARPLLPATQPLIWLDQWQLERAQAAMPGLADVLPVTPLQLGLLFHALRDGPQDGYVEQLVIRLTGPLDRGALRAAADALLTRHAALRTGFLCDGVPRPIQLVAERVAVPWQQTELPDVDEAAFARLARQDLHRGFDIGRPPLLRLRLVTMADGEHRLVITYHHLVLDGWSTTLLVRDLCTLYRAGALPPVAPLTDALRWLAGQDRAAAAEAWRLALAGAAPTLVTPQAPPPNATTPAEDPAAVTLDLTEDATTAATELARRHGVTLNTLVLAAWGTLLGELTGHPDVVFGTTASWRPIELPGMQDTVGMFVNTVPVRVRLAGSLADTAARLHTELVTLLAHQHLGLGEIQQLAGWNGSFDTLVVFEHEALRLDPHSVNLDTEPPDGLHLDHIEITDHTHYPIALLATPGRRLRLQLTHRRTGIDPHAMAARLAALLVPNAC